MRHEHAVGAIAPTNNPTRVEQPPLVERGSEPPDIDTVKKIVRALIASGVRYTDIGQAIDIDANTIKQFVHRSVANPRKTPLYYSLLGYIARLDTATRAELKRNEPTIARKLSHIAEKPDADEEEGQNLAKFFMPEYFLYRPSSGSSGEKIVKTKIEVLPDSDRCNFLHSYKGRLGQTRVSQGEIFRRGMNIYFLGKIRNKLGHELIVFQIPNEENCYQFLQGIIMTLDSDWRPIATRVMLLSNQQAGNGDIGPADSESLSSSERSYLKLLTEGAQTNFYEDKIIPL